MNKRHNAKILSVFLSCNSQCHQKKKKKKKKKRKTTSLHIKLVLFSELLFEWPTHTTGEIIQRQTCKDRTRPTTCSYLSSENTDRQISFSWSKSATIFHYRMFYYVSWGEKILWSCWKGTSVRYFFDNLQRLKTQAKLTLSSNRDELHQFFTDQLRIQFDWILLWLPIFHQL